MKSLLIIGYGSQAKTWSHNLRDSGWSIAIGLRPKSASINKATADGFEVVQLGNSVSIHHEMIAILTPDHTHVSVLSHLENHALNDARIIYAHGVAVMQHQVQHKYKRFKHLLLAPKAVAGEMRELYIQGKPIPGAFSTQFSNSDEDHLLSLAKDLGMTSTIVKTNFEEETICDLFSEQSVLCSVLPFALEKSFSQLTRNGVSPEMAYLECCFEAKLILTTILKKGFSEFFNIVSPNALIGGNKAMKLLESSEVSEIYDKLFQDIKNHQFFKEVDGTDVDSLRKELTNTWSKKKISKIWEKLHKDFH